MNGNTARIFGGGLPTNEPRRPRNANSQPHSAPAPTPVVSLVRPNAQATKQPPAVASAIEAEIIRIIESAPQAGETTELAFRRKENELGELFATLSIAESRVLHKRLASTSTSDQVARSFGRMVSERRTRLLAFLADVRRREAVASARRVKP